VFTNTCKKRRALGMVVDAQYLQAKMRFAVAQSGKDPENKFKVVRCG
jgi:hypothetical protein